MTKIKTILFVDLETTGLNPGAHDVVEITAYLTDLHGWHVYRKVSTLVCGDLTRADPAAMAVNGITAEDLVGAPRGEEVGRQLADILQDDRYEVVAWAGQNVGAFDLPFLRAMAPSALGTHNRYVPYHAIDNASLAWPLFLKGEVPNLKLETLCTYFGVPNAGAHRTEADVKRAVAVYRHLMGWGV